MFGAKAPNGLIETETPNGQQSHVISLSQTQGTCNAPDKMHTINMAKPQHQTDTQLPSDLSPVGPSKVDSSNSGNVDKGNGYFYEAPKAVKLYPAPLEHVADQPGCNSISSIDEVGPLSTVVSSDKDGCQIIVADYEDVSNFTQDMGPASLGSECQDRDTVSTHTVPARAWLVKVGSTTSSHTFGQNALSQTHTIAIKNDEGGPATLLSNNGATFNALGAFNAQDEHNVLGGPRSAVFGSLSTCVPVGFVNFQASIQRTHTKEDESAGPNIGTHALFGKDVDPVGRFRGDNLAGNPWAGLVKPSSSNLCSNDQVRLDMPIGRSWAGLFKPDLQDLGDPKAYYGPSRADDRFNTNQEDFNLEYVDHGEKEANLILKMPKDLTIAGQEEWRATLVGRFLGKKLPYSLVTTVTARIWAKDGLIDTLATDSGYFFFTFSSEENRDAVLDRKSVV